MANFDEQRAERDFNMNPPTNAPGQGNDGWGDLFPDSSQGSSSNGNAFDSAGATDVNAILNGGADANGQPGVMQPNGFGGDLQQNQKPSLGDRLGDHAGDLIEKGAIGAWNYIKLLVTSLKNNSHGDWNRLGTQVCKISAIVVAISLVLFFMSLTFLPSLKGTAEIAVGGLLSIMVGVSLTLAFRKEDVPQEKPEEPIEENNSDENLSWDDSEEDLFEDSDYPEDDEELGDWGDVLGDSEDEGYDGDYDGSFFASNDSFDVNETVESLPDIPAGQYTRQYLFETFSKILPAVEPSFMDMEYFSSDDDEFMEFEGYLRDSAEQTGIKEEKLDELQLLEMRKNLFIIQLIATRPTGLKEKEIANGIADCYKYDEYGSAIEGREGVFARVNSQVGKLIIEIFLCNSVMVSLGDVYRKKSKFILDSKNIMPLVWGIGETGNVFCYDGMKDGNGGIIISGESRSGKSWKGQSLLAQMCMFLSPKELELYFYDVKGEASDYAYLSRVLPHCKGFCGNSLDFNSSIEAILERERKKRTDLLAGKYTNVKDYNKDHPYEKLPTIYIVVDEMATAMSEMKDKDIEIRKKFDSLLIQIATKYPYLEIKLILFPHRIVNDIINKTVSSMISTRAAMGNVPAEELKNALDVKNFQYALVKTGDMAIKSKSLNNGNVVYSHSEVLSMDEQINRKIFDYIGAVWKKLEPDCKTLVENTGTIRSSVTNQERVAKDNSAFANDYTYKGNSGFSDMSEIDDFFNDSSSEGVDESFWDDITQQKEDDTFWNNGMYKG